MNKPHGYDFHSPSRFDPLGDLPETFSRDHLVSNSYTKAYPQNETKNNGPGRSTREDFHPSSKFGSQGGRNGPPTSGFRDQFDPNSYAPHNPPGRTSKEEFHSLASSRFGPQGGRNGPPSSGLRDQYDPNSFAPHNPPGRTSKEEFHSLPSSRFGSQGDRNSPPSSGLRDQFDPNFSAQHNLPGRTTKEEFHSLPSSRFGPQRGRNGPPSSGLRDQYDPNLFAPQNRPSRTTKDEFHSLPSSRFGSQGGRNSPPSSGLRDQFDPNSYEPHNIPGRTTKDKFNSLPSSKFGSQGGRNGPPSSGFRDQFDPNSFAPHNPPGITSKEEFHSLPSSRFGPQGGRNGPPSSGLRDQYDPNSFAPHNIPGRTTKDEFHSLPSSRFGSQGGRISPPSSGLRDQFDPNSFSRHNPTGRTRKNDFDSHPSRFRHQGGRMSPTSSGLRDKFDSYTEHCSPGRRTKDEFESHPSSRFVPQEQKDNMFGNNIRDQFYPDSYKSTFSKIEDRCDFPHRATKVDFNSDHYSRHGPQEQKNILSGSSSAFQGRVQNIYPSDELERDEPDSHISSKSGFRKEKRNYTPGESSRDDFFLKPHLVIPEEKTNIIALDKLHMNPYLRAGRSKSVRCEGDYSSPSRLSDDDSPSREFSGEPDMQLQSKFPLGLKEGYFQATRRFGTEPKPIPEQKRIFINKSRERGSSPACNESDRMMSHFQDRESYVLHDREILENLQMPRESREYDKKTRRFSSNAFKEPPQLEYREKKMEYVFKEREYPPLKRQYDGDDSRSFEENVKIVETRTHRFDEPYETRQIVKKIDSYSIESKSLHRIQKNKYFIEKNKSRQMSPEFQKRSSFRPTSGEYSEYMRQSREGRNTEFSEYVSDDEMVDFIEATDVSKTCNEEPKPGGIERLDVSKTPVSGGNDRRGSPVRPQTTSAERRTDSNSGSGQIGRGSPGIDMKDTGEGAILRRKEIREKLRKRELRKRKRQAAARLRILRCDDLTLPSRLRTLDPNECAPSGDSDHAEDSRHPAELLKESDSLSGNDDHKVKIKKIECSDNRVTLEESEQHSHQKVQGTSRLSGSQKKRYSWLLKNGYIHEEALEKCKDPIGTHKPKGTVIETKAANRISLSKSGTDLSEKQGKHKKIVLDFPMIPPDVAELTMGVQGREKSSILDSLEDLETNYQLPWLNGVQKTRYIWLRKRGYSSEEALEYSTDPSFSHLGKGNKRAGDSKQENLDRENKRSK